MFYTPSSENFVLVKNYELINGMGGFVTTKNQTKWENLRFTLILIIVFLLICFIMCIISLKFNKK